MQDHCTYHIEVLGQADEHDLNKMSPIEATVVRLDKAATQLVVRTDQSGLIGLIRHLHGRGYLFLNISREG